MTLTTKKNKFYPGELVVLRAVNGDCFGYDQIDINVDGYVLGGQKRNEKWKEHTPFELGSLALLINVVKCAGIPDSEPYWAYALVGTRLMWIPGWNIRPLRQVVHPTSQDVI